MKITIDNFIKKFQSNLKEKTNKKYTQEELYFIYKEVFNTIYEVLESGKKVSVLNFGTFKIRTRKGYQSKNAFGEYSVPTQSRISFNEAKTVKNNISNFYKK
jgi:nucleoid DNA-binding protein